MSAAKKRRIEEEGRTFQEQWTVKYFFVAHPENTQRWAVTSYYSNYSN